MIGAGTFAEGFKYAVDKMGHKFERYGSEGKPKVFDRYLPGDIVKTKLGSLAVIEKSVGNWEGMSLDWRFKWADSVKPQYSISFLHHTQHEDDHVCAWLKHEELELVQAGPLHDYLVLREFE